MNVVNLDIAREQKGLEREYVELQDFAYELGEEEAMVIVQRTLADRREAERKKILYAVANWKEWAEIGTSFRQRRETLGLSMAGTARKLGIGWGRLRRFEAGEPVRDAKLLARCYDYFLREHEAKK